MLKVDFSNAFNMVDRTEMLAQVYEKLPGLYRWVEYCYSNPAHLFFGSCVLQSAAGVQQGDPLGPLIGSVEDVHKVFELIQAGPALACTYRVDNAGVSCLGLPSARRLSPPILCRRS